MAINRDKCHALLWLMSDGVELDRKRPTWRHSLRKHTSFCGKEEPAGCGEETRVCEMKLELAFKHKNRAIFFVSLVRHVSRVQLYQAILKIAAGMTSPRVGMQSTV
jgi:hypothetical protein